MEKPVVVPNEAIKEGMEKGVWHLPGSVCSSRRQVGVLWDMEAELNLRTGGVV